MTSVWITEREAERLTGRGRWALRAWRQAGKVRSRRFKSSREYELQSLRWHMAYLDYVESTRVAHHWHREEAFALMTGCLRQDVRLPTDHGLARIFDVSGPQGSAWKRQWISRLANDTFIHSDEEIAAKANTTVRNAGKAREEWQQHKRTKFRKYRESGQ